MSLITLQTDFGTQDAFVAAMKAVIWRLAPGVGIIDITHDIPPYDVRLAGLNWLALFDLCGPGTVHAGVIDPGVGTERDLVLVSLREQWFLVPDNGLLTPMLEMYGPPSQAWRVIPGVWTAPHPHPTFHGRDIIAPVAAHLALGHDPALAGPPMDPDTLRRLPWPRPEVTAGVVVGQLLYVDRFGNCWTNIRFADLTGAGLIPSQVQVMVGEQCVQGIQPSYGNEIGALVCVVNSVGYIELAQVQGNAATHLQLALDAPVRITAA